jgi:hypothetical protein
VRSENENEKHETENMKFMQITIRSATEIYYSTGYLDNDWYFFGGGRKKLFLLLSTAIASARN